MSIQSYKNSFGFTLIETVVAIGLFTIIGGGSILLIGSMVSTNRQLGTVAADADQARQVIFRIMKELRNSESSNTGAYSIAQANPQELIFYSNIDGGSDIERIRYYLSNNNLYRGVVKPTGTPYTYNLGSESSVKLLSDLATGSQPLFYYFPGSFTGTEPALIAPINITQIRYLRMDILLKNKAGATGTNVYSISGGATIRSLKSNLGE